MGLKLPPVHSPRGVRDVGVGHGRGAMRAHAGPGSSDAPALHSAKALPGAVATLATNAALTAEALLAAIAALAAETLLASVAALAAKMLSSAGPGRRGRGTPASSSARSASTAF
jgi:hypothetical protein